MYFKLINPQDLNVFDTETFIFKWLTEKNSPLDLEELPTWSLNFCKLLSKTWDVVQSIQVLLFSLY